MPPLPRLLHGILVRMPAPRVDALRRRRRAAVAVETVAAHVFRPLYGRSVVIRHGEAAGLVFHVERPSLAWAGGKVELPVQHELRRLLRPGGVFFDVGASVGFFTVLAARIVGPNGTVVAFEPQDTHREILERNCALNRLGNVVVVPEVVSGAPGRRLLHASGRGTAHVVERSRDASGRAVDVAATSVDAFLATHAALVPDVVKIDVEGHEADVLDGMAATLSVHRPSVICEVHGTNAAVVSRLEAHGYRVATLDPSAGVEAAPPGTHLVGLPR